MPEPHSEEYNQDPATDIRLISASARAIWTAVGKAVHRVFPDATDIQRTALATNLFLCLNEEGIGLYVQEQEERSDARPQADR